MFRILMQDIADFHKKFGKGYTGPFRGLGPSLSLFRLELINEEAQEWHTAQEALTVLRMDEQPDKVEVTHQMAKSLDAVIDLLYVVLGAAHLQGFTERELFEAWTRVHDANMKKVAGASPRSLEFDIIKPEGWEPPRLEDLVEDHELS